MYEGQVLSITETVFTGGIWGVPCLHPVDISTVKMAAKFEILFYYRAFLFENLRRAVDDLYRTCESDENIPATKEVILVFENYVRDFKNLADW